MCARVLEKELVLIPWILSAQGVCCAKHSSPKASMVVNGEPLPLKPRVGVLHESGAARSTGNNTRGERGCITIAQKMLLWHELL